jgi:hypothetical protein
MIIAIDYDNTYTADSETFNKLIILFQSAGHTVICLTGRGEEETFSRPVKNTIGKLIPIVFAGTKWKREAAKEAGYQVDIFIDDMPESIGPQLIINGGWSQD